MPDPRLEVRLDQLFDAVARLNARFELFDEKVGRLIDALNRGGMTPAEVKDAVGHILADCAKLTAKL